MRISIDGIGVRTHMGRPAQSGTVRAEAQGHHHIISSSDTTRHDSSSSSTMRN